MQPFEMAQFALKDLERIEIATEEGKFVSGRLTGFDDGIFEIEGLDRSWSIRDGAIIVEQPRPSREGLATGAAAQSNEKTSDDSDGPVIRIEPISVAVSPANVREDREAIRFNITLEPASDQMLALIYTTIGGIAIADEDYVSTQGVMSVKPGTKSVSIDVPLINDENREPSERFTLYLAIDPTAARLELSSIEGVIIDD